MKSKLANVGRVVVHDVVPLIAGRGVTEVVLEGSESIEANFRVNPSGGATSDRGTDFASIAFCGKAVKLGTDKPSSCGLQGCERFKFPFAAEDLCDASSRAYTRNEAGCCQQNSWNVVATDRDLKIVECERDPDGRMQ